MKQRGRKRKNQDLWPSEKITALALRWKDLNASRQDDQAMAVLNEIITLSTPMFISFARHSDIANTVQLDILVAAAHEKVVTWISKWDGKRSLHNYFTKCCHHCYLSELQRVKTFRAQYHCTSDNLETIHGTEDHSIDKKDVAQEFKDSLKDLYCRWGSESEKLAIRCAIDCVVDMDNIENYNRQACVRTIAYAAGIPMDLAKFFLQWTLSAMRGIAFKKIYMPFTEEDIIRHCESYTNFVDLYDLMTHEQIKKLIATHGGQKIHIPTVAKIAKLKESAALTEEVMFSSLDPATVEKIAQRHKKSLKTANDVYKDMIENLSPDRAGEHAVYE